MQIIKSGGRYLRLQDGQFDNSISSCFARSLTILAADHIMEQMKESKAVPVLKKIVTRSWRTIRMKA
ncbi:MAG: hypothetical protein ACLTW9_03495 [Enterocloster sp.]